MVNRLLNRHDGVVAAQVFCQLLSKSFCGSGVIHAWHVYQQDILRPKDMSIEGSRYRGVNAAGNADNYFLHMNICQKAAYAVGNSRKNMSDGIGLLPFVLRHAINRFQLIIAQLLHIFRQAVCHNALAVVNGRGAVKGVDGFAIILDTHIVYIEKGYACLFCQPAKNPVTLAVFAQGIR